MKCLSFLVNLSDAHNESSLKVEMSPYSISTPRAYDSTYTTTQGAF